MMVELCADRSSMISNRSVTAQQKHINSMGRKRRIRNMQAGEIEEAAYLRAFGGIAAARAKIHAIEQTVSKGLGAILSLCDYGLGTNANAHRCGGRSGQETMVAGAGFEPAAFRL